MRGGEAFGTLRHRPPDRYRPEELARALVAVTASGKEEFTLGGEARARVAVGDDAPMADRVLALPAGSTRTARALDWHRLPRGSGRECWKPARV
jgi:hypothetical protein